MAGVLHTASQKINADTAGLTHVPEPPSVSTGAPSPPTLSEWVHGLPTHFGGLSQIFSDPMADVPTEVPEFVNTDLVQPTDSILGKLGGLRPNPATSATSPSPNVASDTSVPVGGEPTVRLDPGPKTDGSQVLGTWARVRKALGV